MDLKKSFFQFEVMDGLIGLIVMVLVLPLLFIFYIGVNDGLLLLELLFFSPLTFVFLIGFLSLGMGGRLLEDVTTRWSWIKPILIISIISLIIGIISFLLSVATMFGGGAGDSLISIATSLILAVGLGFLIASFAGLLFNPANRILKLIIGTIPSLAIGILLSVWIFASAM